MKLFPAPYRAFCYSEVVLVSVVVLETMSRLINREIILPDFSNWYLSGNRIECSSQDVVNRIHF